jgi:predicted nucleic acid-binding protein
MILVVDANVILAALIKDGKTREVLMSRSFKFVAPDFIKDETQKHKAYVKKKAGLSDVEFDLLLNLIFSEIETIPETEYNSTLKKAKDLIEDVNDVPYVACCLALSCDAVWTNDDHYKTEKGLKIVKTEYLLTLM